VVPIRDSKDIFYCNFQVGIQVHLVGYGDIHLGFATLKQVKAKARAKVHAKGHVATTSHKLTNNKKGEGGEGKMFQSFGRFNQRGGRWVWEEMN
jgi:hypothetical protein